MIGYEKANELLAYNPHTGELRWRKGMGNNVQAGDVAGTVCGRYRRVIIGKKQYMAHRLAWLLYYGEWPKKEIDHINRDMYDNRIENLRDVSTSTNQRNAKRRIDNKSGVTGVNYHKPSGKWAAYIVIIRTQKYLGTFEDWFDAVCARKTADAKYGFHPNHGRQ